MEMNSLFKTGPKIVFIDLDDTLLNDDKMVSDENKYALQDWLEAGNYVAIATGRSEVSSFPIMEELDLMKKGCYLVGYQGGVSYDASTREKLHATYLNNDAAIDLLNAIYDAGLYAHTFNDDIMLVPNECDNMMKYWSITRVPYKVFNRTEELRGMNLFKVIAVAYDYPDELVKFQQKYMEKENGVLQSFFSSPYFLEYTPFGSGKGVGIMKLSEILGIPRETVIAIGDERNDISMIEAAGIGVCMKNGHPDAKAVADYITENDHNNSGVAEVIYKYI